MFAFCEHFTRICCPYLLLTWLKLVAIALADAPVSRRFVLAVPENAYNSNPSLHRVKLWLLNALSFMGVPLCYTTRCGMRKLCFLCARGPEIHLQICISLMRGMQTSNNSLLHAYKWKTTTTKHNIVLWSIIVSDFRRWMKCAQW